MSCVTATTPPPTAASLSAVDAATTTTSRLPPQLLAGVRSPQFGVACELLTRSVTVVFL